MNGNNCSLSTRLTLDWSSFIFTRTSGVFGGLDRTSAALACLSWNQPMTTDALSDVLRSVHLRGAVFYYLSFGHEWAVEAPAASEIAGAVIPGAEHVMEYHVITKGRGWAAIVGESPVQLETGDIVMFPHGDAHVLSSAPGIRPTRLDPDWVYATRDDPKPIPVVFHTPQEFSYGTPAPESENNLVCGFLGCDLRLLNPLLATLPRLLHLPAAGDGAWISQVMEQAVKASQEKRAGGEAVLERISEMMFVDAVRRHAERVPEENTGWLAGLRDRQVGRALWAAYGVRKTGARSQVQSLACGAHRAGLLLELREEFAHMLDGYGIGGVFFGAVVVV